MQVLKFDQLVTKSPQIEELCKCMICLEIFIDPVCCETCENHFCSSCLTTWSHNLPPRSCPICNKLKEKPGQRILKNMLSELQFYCCFKINGCSEQLKYSDYFQHLKKCQYQFTKCLENGCEQEILLINLQQHNELCQFKILQCKWCDTNYIRKDIQEHENSTCEQRCLPCQQCNELIKVCLIPLHNETCPELIINCYWCQQELKKKEQDNHNLIDCPKIPIQCSGCAQVFQRIDYKSHIDICPLIEIQCRSCGLKLQKQFMDKHCIPDCIGELHSIISSQQNQITQLQQFCKYLSLQMDEIQNKPKNIKFSHHYKHQGIELQNNCKQAFVTVQNQIIKDRLVFIKNQSNQPILLEFTSITDKFVALGYARYSNISEVNDYYQINHGAYLFSSNGIVFISHSQEDNGKKKGFTFVKNQKLELYYYNDTISVQNMETLEKLVIKIPQSTQEYYPVICLRGSNDSIQIIN